MQTKFGFHGNCMSAVMATMFQMPLEDVPYFMEDLEEGDHEIFNQRVDDFLKSLGYFMEAL